MAEDIIPPDDDTDATDVEKLAELLAEQIVALKAEIAELRASAPQPQEPLQPVVNISTPPSEVVVNVAASEMPAPTYAPNITVQSAPAQVIASPEINLHAESLNVSFKAEDMVRMLENMANIIGAGNALMVAEFVKLSAAIHAQAEASTHDAHAMRELLADNTNAASRQAQTLEEMVRTMNAPKEIISDDKGQPTGIVVKRAKK